MVQLDAIPKVSVQDEGFKVPDAKGGKSLF